MPLLLLELNEINFDHVRSYVELGKLPVLGRLIARHGVTETVSERKYDELEPWIQWVTAHTGMTLAEHKVFRLGDIVKHDIPQIWEALEAQGLKVGAISPMNAKNRCRAPAFFVPDPWTPTRVSGSRTMKRLYKAVAQAVNDNAQSRVTASSAAGLLAGLAAYARPVNYGGYLRFVRSGGAAAALGQGADPRSAARRHLHPPGASRAARFRLALPQCRRPYPASLYVQFKGL